MRMAEGAARGGRGEGAGGRVNGVEKGVEEKRDLLLEPKSPNRLFYGTHYSPSNSPPREIFRVTYRVSLLEKFGKQDDNISERGNEGGGRWEEGRGGDSVVGGRGGGGKGVRGIS